MWKCMIYFGLNVQFLQMRAFPIYSHTYTITIKQQFQFISKIESDHQVFRPPKSCIENRNTCSGYNLILAFGIFSRQICRRNWGRSLEHSGSLTGFANRNIPNWFEICTDPKMQTKEPNVYVSDRKIGVLKSFWVKSIEQQWSVSFFPFPPHPVWLIFVWISLSIIDFCNSHMI